MGITAKPKVKKEIKFTDRQATHWGTCQVCGKHHKVDKKYNVIAEHGYTLMYGGQSGSCFGSKHKPLELSCSISKSWVEQLQRIKANNHKTELSKLFIRLNYFSNYLEQKHLSDIDFDEYLVWLFHYGSLPEGLIDHDDHNTLNNRIANPLKK